MDDSTRQTLLENFWYIIGGSWVFGGIIIWLLPKRARLFKRVLAVLMSAVTTFMIFERSGVAVFWYGMNKTFVVFGVVMLFAIVYFTVSVFTGTHVQDK